MKALLIIVFTGFGIVAMAQQRPDDRTVTFDSPEPTIKVFKNEQADPNAVRITFDSPEIQVKQVKNNNSSATDKPRVEFTSPEPTSISSKPKDE